MIEGVSYKQIKHIFDWQITDEAQRHALADVVNGIRAYPKSAVNYCNFLQ